MRIGCIRTITSTRRRRRTASLAGLGVLAVLTVAVPASVDAAPAAAPDPSARTTIAGGSARESGPVTVAAPGAGDGATVTVSKTSDLVNQTVQVSWKGFRPSSATLLQNSGDSLDVNTENPVRVYQCRGADPSSSSDCYGSPGFRGIDATDTSPAVDSVPAFTYPGQQDAYDATPDGPANWQDNVTREDGTGEVTIQLFTKRESAALACNSTSPCSVVVVPNYGRAGTGNGATEDQMDAPWAWARRTVVPLSFLPVEDACPLTGDSLRVEGSPFAADALASWRAKTCTLASDAVRVDYTAIGEPQTRSDLTSGTTDVGLVIDPLDADAAADRSVVYAPLAVTGLVVAFQIDDANGKPVTDMKLNPRLVAKLITASYRSGGNPAVINNPVNIFRDPEFRALNPGVAWPGGAPGNHPLLLADLSDSTLALTRWIEADKDARAFLAGKPDPWGMTVNSNYKNVSMPFASYPVLDQAMSETFEPIQELDAVARQLSIARFPGATTSVEGGVTVVTKPPRQNPGRREVIGIIDSASAHRFLLNTASLENASGAYVKPTTAGLLAGIENSTVNSDGVTRSVDPTAKGKDIYPLALQVSGGFSTAAEESERTEMANLLSYAASAGQVNGEQVGQLPLGYAPLPANLRKQTLAARTAVLKGATATPSPSATPTAETSATPDPSGAPPDGGGGAPLAPAEPATDSGTPSNAPSPSASSSPATAAPEMISVGSTPATGRMMLLPALGVLALLMLVVGPLLLWFSSTGRGPQWLRR